jgi:hypothetical protein
LLVRHDQEGEHDFGSFDLDGIEILQDRLFDSDFQFHSPAPRDPAVTERVITLMWAEELNKRRL